MLDLNYQWKNFMHDSIAQRTPPYIVRVFESPAGAMFMVLGEFVNNTADIQSIAKAVVTYLDWLLASPLFTDQHFQSTLFSTQPQMEYGFQHLSLLAANLDKQRAMAQTVVYFGVEGLGAYGLTAEKLYKSWYHAGVSHDAIEQIKDGTLTIFDLARENPGLIFFGMFRE